MFTTVILFLMLASALVAIIALWLIMLRLGAYWARIPGVTTGRALLATVTVTFVQIICAAASAAFKPTTPGLVIVAELITLGCLIGLSVLVIQVVLRSSAWQAFRAWLPTLVVGLFALLLALLVRSFFSEAFKIPTNAMCPTILGNHLTDVCPTCGKAAFGSPHMATSTRDGEPMICENFHVHINRTPSTTSDGDRILVMKPLRPRRWDIIVFRFPGDPTMNYVKRLVGLPGEEVFIKDGSVWINGQRLESPESLQGLRYVTDFPQLPNQMTVWGTPDRPAKLGEGEYFVLGDFSQQSADSRLWQSGAPGHPSYAVPESNLIGVVTHIYWPPNRWRILR